MNKQTIRVIYPAGNERIVLRTEQSWDVQFLFGRLPMFETA
jgi:hypothetical protein